MKVNGFGVVVLVAGGKRLTYARYADGNGSLHAMIIAVAYRGAATPGHEFRVPRNIGHQVEHLCTGMRD